MNNYILLLLASTFALLLAHVNVGTVYADQTPEVGVTAPLVSVPVQSESITEPSGLLVAPEASGEQESVESLMLAPSESAGDYDDDEDEDIEEDEEEIAADDEGGYDDDDDDSNNGDDDGDDDDNE